MDSSVTKKKTTMNKVVNEKSNKGRKRSKSRSPLRDKKKEKINYDIPDKSYGDFYCKACDSHMNSEDIWAMHLQGKRHLKNTKSSAEELESEKKYDYVDEDPEALADINCENSPIVGLQHVCEMQRLEQKPLYSCFLCNSTIPNSHLLIEHLIGLKHRLAYLKEHDPDRYRLIHDSNLKKGQVEPVVEECVAKHEFDSGRGKMIVKRERNRNIHTWGVKKPERENRRTYPAYREDPAYDRKRSSSYHSDRSTDYGYGDRDRYSSSYSENLPGRREQGYELQETSRDDSYIRYDRTSEHRPLDRNYMSDNSRDLRELLEQRKTPAVDISIPDEALGIISALPTVSFLQLVLFKLDDLKIEDEIEVKLLDRVVNKATTLAMNVKSKLLTPSLRMQFQESMAQNGIQVESSVQQSSQAVQNLLKMVGECKALSSQRTPTAAVNYPTIQPPPSRPFLQGNSSHQNPIFQSNENPGFHSNQNPNFHSNQNPDFQSNQNPDFQSNQNPSFTSRYSSPYSSSYSASCAIPGLTLAQEDLTPEKKTNVSPFDQLEARAKSLFGQWGDKQNKHGF